MNKIFDEMPFLTQLIDMLEQQMGSNTEIVLHDLMTDYEHTIVDIRNGHITNRNIGDCGSNLGLQVLSGVIKDGDKYNYITHTKNGKILRSSTMFIKDANGQVIGSLCINQDITQMVEFEQYLRNCNHYDLGNNHEAGDDIETKEIFVNNVGELMDYLLLEAVKHVGKSVTSMDKEDRCKFLKYLDEKGAFVISKAGERTCEFLGISKYTLYNYLDLIRSDRKPNPPV